MQSKMEVIVVSSPSGTKRAAALRKLKEYLGASSVEVVDLEEKLVEVVEKELARSGSSLGFVKPFIGEKGPSIQDLTRHLPRDCVSRLWREACDHALEQLKRARREGKRRLVLSLHLTYYGGRFYEFYSPIDCGHLLNDMKAVRVVTLIDDVYDMYVRLAEAGAVFDISQLVRDEYQRIALSGDPAPEKEDDQYLLAVGMVIRTLIMCLMWRSKEILAGELLAATAACEHKLLATKHPLSVGAPVVLGETPAGDAPRGCYLSHPISRPRRKAKEAGSWPPCVGDLHAFVTEVLKGQSSSKTMSLIMPSAIDEYRIAKGEDGLLAPALVQRWPLVADAAELLYSLPDGYEDYAEFEQRRIASIFDPPIDPRASKRFSDCHAGPESYKALSHSTRLQVAGMLESLLNLVWLQLTNRDHALVRQCTGLLLYRPLYEELGWSGGVTAEVLHWRNLVRSAADTSAEKRAARRAMFLHTKKESDALREKVSNPRVGEVVRQALLDLCGSDGELGFERINYNTDDWVEDLLGSGPSMLQNGKNISNEFAQQIRTKHRSELEEAAQQGIRGQVDGLLSCTATECGEPERVRVVTDPALGVLDSLDEEARSGILAKLVQTEVLPFFLQ